MSEKSGVGVGEMERDLHLAGSLCKQSIATTDLEVGLLCSEKKQKMGGGG